MIFYDKLFNNFLINLKNKFKKNNFFYDFEKLIDDEFR